MFVVVLNDELIHIPVRAPKSKNPKANYVRFRILLVTLSGICRFRHAEPRQGVASTACSREPMGSPDGSTQQKRQD
jgi:hypothetical protein